MLEGWEEYYREKMISVKIEIYLIIIPLGSLGDRDPPFKAFVCVEG